MKSVLSAVVLLVFVGVVQAEYLPTPQLLPVPQFVQPPVVIRCDCPTTGVCICGPDCRCTGCPVHNQPVVIHHQPAPQPVVFQQAPLYNPAPNVQYFHVQQPPVMMGQPLTPAGFLGGPVGRCGPGG